MDLDHAQSLQGFKQLWNDNLPGSALDLSLGATQDEVQKENRYNSSFKRSFTGQ